MKLISLHINNFGKLKDYDFKFDNITSINEDNGFGKTTLASFIEAMFYGLEPVKSNSKFNDRKHFFPFNGGTCGGNLIFKKDNKEYRIERTFDEKSEVKDTLKVYIDGNETDELGQNIGEKIFGINKESFEKIIFITADKIEIQTDSDINQKLNNYVDNIDENFDLDKIIKKINVAKKDLKEKTDKITEEIKNSKNTIINLKKIKNSLDERMYKELTQVTSEQEKIEKEYESANGRNTILAYWENYDKQINDINNLKTELQDLNDKYKNGLPSQDEIEQIISLNTEINQLQSDLKSLDIQNDKLKEYKELESKFEEIKEEDFSILADNNKKADEISKKIETLANKFNSKNELEILNNFNNTDIDEKISQIKDDNEQYEQLLNDLNNTKDEEVKTPSNSLTKQQLIISIAIAAIGLILIIVGICLMNVSLIALIILLVFGILFVFAAGFYYMNVRLNINNNNIVKTPTQKEVKNSKLNSLKEKLLIEYARYHYSLDNNMAFETLSYIFFKDYDQYKNIKTQQEENQKEIDELSQELDEINLKSKEFLTKIDCDDTDFNNAYINTNAEFKQFKILEESFKTKNLNKEDTEKSLKEKLKKKEEIYKKYQLDLNIDAQTIKVEINDISKLEKNIENKEKQAKDYKESKNLVERLEDNNIDITQLKQNKENIEKEFAKLSDDVQKAENEIDGLDDEEQKLDQFEKTKKENNKKIKLYKDLEDAITKADHNLKNKYVQPIKDKFTYYSNLIEKTIDTKISMDTNYQISFENNGMLRSCEHLSSGNLTICALCFRLALLDNMFTEDKPFIIMDDPFVSLDASHLEKTKKLIDKLAKDKQIIYFCCHESRELANNKKATSK